MNTSTSAGQLCPRCHAELPADAVGGLCPRCLMLGAMQPTQDGEPAGTMPAPAPEEIAAHFPQLEIIELLGRGGMGVVYKARQISLGRMVALKLLAPERVADPKFAERFAHEAQALAALSHPNIVTIHDFGQAGGFYFLLMEFVDGVNLRQAMKAGRFTPEQALAIVPPVCEALQFAHEHGIVHRDIKPENLLLDKTGRVKIADFGIAKMLGPASLFSPQPPGSGFAEGTLASAAGTPQYMAPEQKAHRPTDHRADIYSLGVVLYELLTGELPADKLQPPSRKVQIDVRLDEIVLRALEETPELRYQTAGEFRTQVEAAVAQGGAAQPPTITDPSDGGASKNPPQRFSRTAVVGALWIVVLPVGIAINTFATVYNAALPARAATRWLIGLPGMALIVLGLIGFLGAPILGWTAVSQIRRSAGKLCGLGLAVFAGLFFPLLALNALLWWIWTLVIKMLMGSSLDPNRYLESWIPSIAPPLVREWVMVATVVTALVVDYLIVRRVWRAVNESPADTRTNAPASPAKANAPLSHAVMFFVLLSVILGGLVWARRLNSSPVFAKVESAPLDPGGPLSSVFAPVIECEVKNETAINFDLGEKMKIPEFEATDPGFGGIAERAAATATWMEQEGMDALFTGRSLSSFGMKARALTKADAWDAMTPSELAQVIGSIDSQARPQVVLIPAGEGVATYAFQTREGGQGLLQVLALTDDGVKLGYKLIQGGKTPASDVALPAATDPNFNFGPVIERTLTAADTNRNGVVAFRFQSNESFKPPVELTGHFRDFQTRGFTAALRQWMHAEKVDLLLYLGEKGYDVMSLDLRDGFAGQPKEWDTILPGRFVPLLAQMEKLNTNAGPAVVSGCGYRDGPSSVNVFRTRDGLVGYYQLRGLQDVDGYGVHLRYKLVQRKETEGL